MEKKLEVLLLNQKEVIESGGLDFKKAIEDAEKAYIMDAKDEAEELICPQIWTENAEVGTAFFAFHPGELKGDIDIAGVKSVCRYPNNPSRFGIPSVIAITELMDRDSGIPLALVEGTLITAVRTGVSTAVGAKYLARKDSKIVGLTGAGVMQTTQLIALAEVLPELEYVKIYDIYPEKAKNFSKELSDKIGIEVKPVDSAEKAVRNSDVVAPATTVTLDQRYIEAEWIKEGAFLANVSDNDYKFNAVKKADRIVVDGEKQFNIPVVIGEMVKRNMIDPENTQLIGAVINKKAPARQNDNEIIFFSALGMGLHDITIAKRVYDKAKKLGIGQKWKIWDEPYWV